MKFTAVLVALVIVTNGVVATLPTSPSNLQMALFAHMSYFPFDFNEGERPAGRGYSSLHYEPFEQWVMTEDTSEINNYGFSFANEMNGWYMAKVYENVNTGFAAVLYSCEENETVVIALRGTGGELGMSLLLNYGTWWCNFRSLAGETHSHLESLKNFLNNPEVMDILNNSNIYITGHSLGGYLAYIATYELTQMGFDIQQTIAFSAPIFSAYTVEKIARLSPEVRGRMVHYYVPTDLIAGIVGVDVGEFPGYASFDVIVQILDKLRDVRGIDVPPALMSIISWMGLVESWLPVGMPDHMLQILWTLTGAVSAEALEITNEFRQLIEHRAVAQTWFTPREDVPWDINASAFSILRNHPTELATEIGADVIQRIFDVDSHFMMNFYSEFSSAN